MSLMIKDHPSLAGDLYVKISQVITIHEHGLKYLNKPGSDLGLL